MQASHESPQVFTQQEMDALDQSAGAMEAELEKLDQTIKQGTEYLEAKVQEHQEHRLGDPLTMVQDVQEAQITLIKAHEFRLRFLDLQDIKKTHLIEKLQEQNKALKARITGLEDGHLLAFRDLLAQVTLVSQRITRLEELTKGT